MLVRPFELVEAIAQVVPCRRSCRRTCALPWAECHAICPNFALSWPLRCIGTGCQNLVQSRISVCGVWREDFTHSRYMHRDWYESVAFHGSTVSWHAVCIILHWILYIFPMLYFLNIWTPFCRVWALGRHFVVILWSLRLRDNAFICAAPPCSLMGPACASVHRRTWDAPQGDLKNFKVRLSNRIFMNMALRIEQKQLFHFFWDMFVVGCLGCFQLLSCRPGIGITTCHELEPIAVYSNWTAIRELGVQTNVYGDAVRGIENVSWFCYVIFLHFSYCFQVSYGG